MARWTWADNSRPVLCAVFKLLARSICMRVLGAHPAVFVNTVCLLLISDCLAQPLSDNQSGVTEVPTAQLTSVRATLEVQAGTWNAAGR
jgi:hypothetical protein